MNLCSSTKHDEVCYEGSECPACAAYQLGYDNGKSDGYDEGNTVGYNEGRSGGYSEGLAERKNNE